MVTVGTRLRIIRKDAGLSQVELGKLAGSNQSAINRYETDRAAVPYRMLIWYAQYFDVSMDYIFGLCDDKRGRIVTVSPEGAEEYVRRKPDWSEFVEACFEPGSESQTQADGAEHGGRTFAWRQGGIDNECSNLRQIQQ